MSLAADNKRTEQICHFIIQNGLSREADPNSFEGVAQKWVDFIRSNKDSVHPSDLEIIKQKGLTDLVFQSEALSQLAELQKHFVDLGRQIETLIKSLSLPQFPQMPQASKIKSKSSQPFSLRKARAMARLKRNPEFFATRVFNCIHKKGEATRADLHSAVGGCFDGEMIQTVIDRLIDKKMIYEEHREAATGKKRAHPVYKVFDPNAITHLPQGNFNNNTKEWQFRHPDKNIISLTTEQLSHIFKTEVPDTQEGSLPFWEKYLNMLLGK